MACTRTNNHTHTEERGGPTFRRRAQHARFSSCCRRHPRRRPSDPLHGRRRPCRRSGRPRDPWEGDLHGHRRRSVIHHPCRRSGRRPCHRSRHRPCRRSGHPRGRRQDDLRPSGGHLPPASPRFPARARAASQQWRPFWPSAYCIAAVARTRTRSTRLSCAHRQHPHIRKLLMRAHYYRQCARACAPIILARALQTLTGGKMPCCKHPHGQGARDPTDHALSAARRRHTMLYYCTQQGAGVCTRYQIPPRADTYDRALARSFGKTTQPQLYQRATMPSNEV